MENLIDTVIELANQEIDAESYMDRWEDPGVYPSGAGGYAMPSYDAVVFPPEVEIVIKDTPGIEDMVGETWTKTVSIGDESADVKCKIERIFKADDGEVGIYISIK
jgi:hypothetical protein